MWKVRNGGMSKKVTPLVTDYLFTQIERQLREAA